MCRLEDLSPAGASSVATCTLIWDTYCQARSLRSNSFGPTSVLRSSGIKKVLLSKQIWKAHVNSFGTMQSLVEARYICNGWSRRIVEFRNANYNNGTCIP